MRFADARELFLKYDKARLFIEAFEENPYRGPGYNQFEKDMNLKLIGKPEIENPADHLDYWPATLYCRSVSSQQNDTVIAVIKTLVQDNTLSSKLDGFFAGKGKELVTDFFKSIVNNYEFNALIRKRQSQPEQKAKKITSWDSGDLFSYELEDGSVLGGIVIGPVKKFLKGKKADPRSNKLFEFKDYILISLFDIDADLTSTNLFALKGFLATSDAFAKGLFDKAGKRKIIPEDIDFPEYLDEGYFIKGELRLSLPTTDRAIYEATAEYGQNTLNSYLLDFYVLYKTGKGEKIPLYPQSYNLANADLRLDPEKRKKVFELLNENPNSTYLELAQKHGIDVSNYLK